MLTLDTFDYYLDPSRIAQQPATPKESAKLMLVKRDSGEISHHHIADLPDILPQPSVIVRNNTKVIHARLFVTRETGGAIEILLVRPTSEPLQWICMIKKLKKLREGEILTLSTGSRIQLVSKRDALPVIVFLDVDDVDAEIDAAGEMPLPPYIAPNADFYSDYQTSYAKHRGAVAAPTAGLHLTESLCQEIETRDIRIDEITLHVGLGTFKPISDLDTHTMHEEWIDVSAETAARLTQAQASQTPVIAIGTTVARSLETCFDGHYQSYTDFSSIFIKPGDTIRSFNGLLTNFHLPKSTLLLLVSAFSGIELMQTAYQAAIDHDYRFYSFGDAMLIL